jgi:subtilase family serine protease
MHPATGPPGFATPAGKPGPGGGFPCQSPNYKHICYGPSQIRNAYNVSALLDAGVNGRGRTIAIIDAYQNPTMASDLASFDSYFGLAPPPSFKTVAPFGLTPFDPNAANQVSWSGEIALDVEWAHVIAPNANIVLLLAPSDNDADVVATQDYAISHNVADVISMSYGDAESCIPAAVAADQHSAFADAARRGITLVTASGDWGAAQYSCDGSTFIKVVFSPANEPGVTSVGGTQLKADLVTGQYSNETAWNEGVGTGASGGGYSALYSAPAYQAQLGAGGRAVPDVAYSSAYDGGVLVAWGSSGSPPDPVWNIYWIFSGTSAGTPQWAALTAEADQLRGSRLGNIDTALYSAPSGDYHDTTQGNNDWPPIHGYKARNGWDPVTGLGTPLADRIVLDLARSAS